jgi:hypothetical protein
MRRRSSAVFRFFLIFFIIIIGFWGVVSLIGWIGDKSFERKILADGENAQKELNSLLRTGPGNAWEFYSRAIEKARSIKSDRTLSRFLDGDEEIVAEVLEVIKNHQEVIDNIREGARQDYYSYPYKYEQGIAIENPEYLILRRGIDITCIKALYDLENGRSEIALDLLFSVMMVGKHLSTDSPLPYDQLMGFSFIHKAAQVLGIGISAGAFNEHQLEEISVFLADLEIHWPAVATTLKNDLNLVRVTYGYLHPAVGDLLFSDDVEATFLRRFILRLMCWRYLFSPKKALYSSSGMFEEVINDLENIENEEVDTKEKKKRVLESIRMIEMKIKEFKRRNIVFSMMEPIYLSVYKKKLREITKIRLLHISSRIRLFRTREKRFPENVKELAKDLIIDFNTGEEWRYESFGDSVTLSSPGFYDEDKSDDISITLTVKGIKKYLENKRRKFEEKKTKKVE